MTADAQPGWATAGRRVVWTSAGPEYPQEDASAELGAEFGSELFEMAAVLPAARGWECRLVVQEIQDGGPMLVRYPVWERAGTLVVYLADLLGGRRDDERDEWAAVSMTGWGDADLLSAPGVLRHEVPLVAALAEGRRDIDWGRVVSSGACRAAAAAGGWPAGWAERALRLHPPGKLELALQVASADGLTEQEMWTLTEQPALVRRRLAWRADLPDSVAGRLLRDVNADVRDAALSNDSVPCRLKAFCALGG